MNAFSVQMDPVMESFYSVHLTFPLFTPQVPSNCLSAIIRILSLYILDNIRI